MQTVPIILIYSIWMISIISLLCVLFINKPVRDKYLER